jgi:NAD-dependent SIR2 family protein deacetylase
MDAALLHRLVASIQQRRLVVFCGAGLSMTGPSLVPSATGLAHQCLKEYNQRALPALPATASANLETMTEHLFANGYQSLFLHELVNWRPFRRKPNKGHEAVADFLTCGALNFGVTTNFDELL